MPLLSSLANKLTPGIALVYNQSEIHPTIPHIQKINENIFSVLLLKAQKNTIWEYITASFKTACGRLEVGGEGCYCLSV